MNRRDFSAAISALTAYFVCARIVTAAEPAAPKKVTILKVPDDCPCRIFAANGVEIICATYAEIETGVVEQLVTEKASGWTKFAYDENGDVKRVRTTFPAPLTYIRG
jgi:hypothetical protein